MQKELTINISDEIYDDLMDSVGEENASRFIESLLRPVVSKSKESKEYEVKLPPHYKNQTFKIHSPRLADESQAELLELTFIKE
jgi:hypothetical protein